MKTIGSCSVCNGPVQVDETETDAVPKCGQCGATAQNSNGPTIKMKSAEMPLIEEVRRALDDVVNRWCPKTNPNADPAESFQTRMSKALLNVNAFEVDYRRVLAGGRALRGDYPLPLPTKPS